MIDEALRYRDVTLAVLAGGAGTRMGTPKAFLRIGELPILAWLLTAIDWPGPTMLVTALETGRPDGAERFDQHVVDAATGNGPLQGALTALEHLETSRVVIVTVDMPRFDRAKLVWLVEQLSPPMVGVMCRRSASNEQIEPFPAAFERSAIDIVRAHLARGNRAVHRLTSEPTIEAIAAPSDWSADTWLNLNHPDEFARFLDSLS